MILVLVAIVVLTLAWGLAIWRLVIPPAQQLARIVTDLTPILIDLRKTFTGVDNPFADLASILDELHADSGATLRDAIVRTERTIDRLETAAEDAAALARGVKVELERTQHAAAMAGEASRTRSESGRAEDVAADAAAAGSAAVGGPEVPA